MLENHERNERTFVTNQNLLKVILTLIVTLVAFSVAPAIYEAAKDYGHTVVDTFDSD